MMWRVIKVEDPGCEPVFYPQVCTAEDHHLGHVFEPCHGYRDDEGKDHKAVCSSMDEALGVIRRDLERLKGRVVTVTRGYCAP